jgi:pectate lyase
MLTKMEKNDRYLHSYNNYVSNVTSYSHHARSSTPLQINNDVFEDVHNPIICDKDALVQWTNNIYTNCTGEIADDGDGDPFPPWRYYSYYLHAVEEVVPLVTRAAGPKAWVCH